MCSLEIKLWCVEWGITKSAYLYVMNCTMDFGREKDLNWKSHALWWRHCGAPVHLGWRFQNRAHRIVGYRISETSRKFFLYNFLWAAGYYTSLCVCVFSHFNDCLIQTDMWIDLKKESRHQNFGYIDGGTEQLCFCPDRNRLQWQHVIIVMLRHVDVIIILFSFCFLGGGFVTRLQLKFD